MQHHPANPERVFKVLPRPGPKPIHRDPKAIHAKLGHDRCVLHKCLTIIKALPTSEISCELDLPLYRSLHNRVVAEKVHICILWSSFEESHVFGVEACQHSIPWAEALSDWIALDFDPSEVRVQL